MPVAGCPRLFYVTGMEAGALLEVLAACSDAQAYAWLERGLPRAGGAFARGAWFAAYAGAARRFAQPLVLTAEQQSRLRVAGVAVPEVWSLADLARASLLLAAWRCRVRERARVDRDRGLPQGRQRRARGVAARAAALAAAGALRARSPSKPAARNVLDVFAAIACDNPYPAALFPEPHFNQLVLKALFLALPLARVARLARPLQPRARAHGGRLRSRAPRRRPRRAGGHRATARPCQSAPALAAESKGVRHEDVRSAHPHDVAHDRRLRRRWRGRHRRDRSSRRSGSASRARTSAPSRTTSCRCIGWERFRASQFGIRHFCTHRAQPEGGEQPRRSPQGVIALLPRYLEKDGVVAVGEIGFDDMTAGRGASTSPRSSSWRASSSCRC